MSGPIIPSFGEPEPGQTYTDRPGAYVILVDDDGRVATVHTPRGCFLPGGAIEAGESPEAALHREILEETGLEVGEMVLFEEAVDYFLTPTTQQYYQQRSLFFTASLIRQTGEKSEADHKLVWMEAAEAAAAMYRGSQAWVMQVWVEGG